MKTKIYTIGSFSGWRDELKGMISDKYEFDDPRNHSQSSIARLVTDDMNSAMNCPISLIYTPLGKRAGTMSYAELGASRAMGNEIIAVEENEVEDDLIERVQSFAFEDFDNASWWINNLATYGDKNPLPSRDRSASKGPYKGVLFAGDFMGLGDLAGRLANRGKDILVNPDPREIESYIDKADVIVANFDKGHNKKGLFYMGVGYALKIPVIMAEGNKVPYPPLLGLARRVMVGDSRHEQLEYYLDNLESQHVSDEALVYYDLMKKFN